LVPEFPKLQNTRIDRPKIKTTPPHLQEIRSKLWKRKKPGQKEQKLRIDGPYIHRVIIEAQLMFKIRLWRKISSA